MKWIFLICLANAVRGARAQTVTAMVEQLAELKLLEHTTAEGYRIMGTGVDSIGIIMGGEYKLIKQNENVISADWIARLNCPRPMRAQSIADLLLQLELDKEKLTSLKNTLQEMYQGYTTLERGYTNIRDIAEGNFNLHQAFLDALFAVSPAVSGDPRIAVILKTEYSILSGYQSANARWAASGVFTAGEMGYIVNTYSVLLQRCLQSVEELTMVLTADELRMSDADRMQAIGRINTDTQAQLGMMQQLDNNLSIQSVTRLREAGDINTLKALYGLPN